MAAIFPNTQPLTYTEYQTHKEKTMPTKLIINCETGEQTEVELTAEEIAQREADAAKAEADKVAKDAADAAKAQAKAELLDRLGLTAEEAALLVS